MFKGRINFVQHLFKGFLKNFFKNKTGIQLTKIYPLPHRPYSNKPKKDRLKTLRKMEKIQIISIFSLFHNASYLDSIPI